MARRIFKYELDLAVKGVQTVRMPKGARVLSVGIQPNGGAAGVPCFVCWAEVEPEAEQGYAFVRACETGDEAPSDTSYRYVNTLQVLEGSSDGAARMLVWHFYVERSIEAAP